MILRYFFGFLLMSSTSGAMLNRDDGVTFLVIEHIMRIIMSLSHRIVVLHHGEKIAEGAPRNVAVDKRVVDAYLGEEYLLA